MLAGKGGTGSEFSQEQVGMWQGRDDGRAVLGLGLVLVCVPSLSSQGRAGIYSAARKVLNLPGNSEGRAVAQRSGLMGKGFSANPAPSSV